jgi:electron transfer flavoprotein alpha subunit
MAGIYIYSELTQAAAELVTFAKQAGKTAHILAFNQEEAQVAAGFAAETVIFFQGGSQLAENYAKPIAGLLKESGAELFAVISSDRGRDLAARVSGYLECGMISDVATINWEADKLVTTRIMYGGAVIQSNQAQGLAVATIPAGLFAPSSGGTTEIVVVPAVADERVHLIASAPAVKTCVDLTVADKIVCIGLGMEKREDMKIAEQLAEVIGAEIGCTRTIAEERHWLPCYIGISGLSVKPSLMISLGVSGQVQHVVGMRDSKIVAAINNNAKAPIFQAADYGIVGDMNEIVPLLTQALK